LKPNFGTLKHFFIIISLEYIIEKFYNTVFLVLFRMVLFIYKSLSIC